MVPGSKTSRAQPGRRGTAAQCSWKTHWEPVDAGEEAATGPAGRGETQRTREEAENNHGTERSWS